MVVLRGSELERIILTSEQFEGLKEYSCSIPTGKSIGKRWKRNVNAYSDLPAQWVMGTYVPDADPMRVGIKWYRIVVID
jgi:hypothetical protein